MASSAQVVCSVDSVATEGGGSDESSSAASAPTVRTTEPRSAVATPGATGGGTPGPVPGADAPGAPPDVVAGTCDGPLATIVGAYFSFSGGGRNTPPMPAGIAAPRGAAGAGVGGGAAAARACGLALLAQARAAAGSLDQIARVVKLTGFVASTPEFTDQPEVINGCSDLMVEVFGDRGRHARAAVSAPSLPRGVAVEIEAIFEIA